MPPKRRDNELLRMPAPLPVSNIEEFEHYGVVVEKSGEDNETSKKNKVMYLFSPTVRKHCGKLVCSNDWVDYNLGDWMIFTQQKNEAYFGSKHCDDVWKTRIHPYDVTIVQVYVEFFLIPSCISHRKCFNLSEPLTKMWSPQLGGCYSKNMYQLQEGVVYRGWLQYSVNPVNFDEYDVDPEGWPYEPIVYWHLVHCLPHAHDRSKPSFAIEVIGDEEIYMKYRATLINYAEQATEFERNKRITDRAPMNVFEKSQNNRPKMIEFKPQLQHAKTTSANVTKFDLSSPNNSRDDNPIVFTANTFRLVGMNLGPSPLKPAQSPNSCFRGFRTQTPANNQSQDMKQDAPRKTPVNFNSFTPTTKREPKPRKSGFSSILQSPSECSKPWGF